MSYYVYQEEQSEICYCFWHRSENLKHDNLEKFETEQEAEHYANSLHWAVLTDDVPFPFYLEG